MSTDPSTPGPADEQPAIPPQATAPAAPAAAPDPAAFDLDAWIDGVQRPTRDVHLYAPNPAHQDRYRTLAGQRAALEAQLALARAAGEDAERGITDATPQALREQLATVERGLRELQEEMDAAALVVTLEQRTHEEIKAAGARAAAAGVEPDERYLWAIAEAITAMAAAGRPVPSFTPAQLARLKARDTTGEGHVELLQLRLNELCARPSVPSWPGSSTSPGGRTSSAS